MCLLLRQVSSREAAAKLAKYDRDKSGAMEIDEFAMLVRRACSLQPHGMAPATVCDGACNPMQLSLQPYVPGGGAAPFGL